MDSGHGNTRMNVEGDRLSNLPDDLIHRIFSFTSIKHAIDTSVLSPRWRYMWTSMPSLNFSSEDFNPDFVTKVLSERNNGLEVSCVKLTFHEKDNEVSVKSILDYAFSHNVQELDITCLPGKEFKYPLYVFNSQSLKSLTLTGCTYGGPTCEMPALTTLNLHDVKFSIDNTTDRCAGLFSTFGNLKNLTIKKCRFSGLNGFIIRHSGLSSLTLEDGREGVNVVTPQLKNLTIKFWGGKHVISAFNLSSMHIIDEYYYRNDLLHFSTEPIHLEKAEIYAHSDCGFIFDDKTYTQNIISLLQQLYSVRFLTLNWELVKLLSSSVELISHQPSPFVNLKSLKIHPIYSTPPRKLSISPEVKNFLLDSSPDATLTIVSQEDITAVLNIISARNLMGCFQEKLNQLKEKSDTSTAHTESHREDREYILLSMKMIKNVLSWVPAGSHPDKLTLQAKFSGMCAEAYTIMDRLKIQCNKKPRRSKVKFATASHPY